MRDKIERLLFFAVCGLLVFGLYSGTSSVTCLAAEDTETTDTTDEQKTYELDKEVKEWLDSGNAIPAEVRYATYSGSSHLWVVEDKDFSDGKIELSGNNEILILAGTDLRFWLKSQMFFGEGYGKDRVKFIRPGKSTAL